MSDVVILQSDPQNAVIIGGGSAEAIVLPGSGPTGPQGPTGATGSGTATAADRTVLAAIASPVIGESRFLIESGRLGFFVFDTADLSAQVTADSAQGIYVAPSAAPSGASGAWVRQYTGWADPRWWGFTTGTGNGTANSTAITAMLATLKARGYSEAASYINLGTVRFPLGTADVATTIDLTDGTIIFEGETTGQAGAAGSRLKFPAGQTGIRIQRFNTVGSGGAASGSNEFADASIIRGLTLVGGYAGTEGEYHGIHPRARVIIENCGIQGFEGDGIHIDATAGGNPEGNANNFIVRDCRIVSNRDGIFIDGADANAYVIEGVVDLSSNRRWGFNDDSFLSGTIIGAHPDGNGAVAGTTPTMVTHSGNQYGVIDGQAVGASTNAPSGTTADNTWWYYIGAGGVDAGHNIAAWVSGTTYRSGGAYKCKSSNGRAVFVGCYIEGGQGLAQIEAPNFVVGGILASVRLIGTAPKLTGTSGALYLLNSGIKTDLGAEIGGNVISTGTAHVFGTTAGAANVSLKLQASANFASVPMYSGATRVAEYGCDSANGGYIEVPNAAHTQRIIIGSVVHTFNAAGLSFASGKTINFASLTNAVDDAAAAAASVPVGSVYRNGSVLMVRVS